MTGRLSQSNGVTLLELVITITILATLAAGILPLTSMAAKRTKEIELRRNLRTIRTALDDFKKCYDKAVEEKRILELENKSGYPETLEQLVDGYDFGGLYTTRKKFLRRIPPDPMNPSVESGKPQWGIRSYFDKTGSSSWGGEDVYDVYSLSEGMAIDGSKYQEW